MPKPTAAERARRLMALLHIFEPGTKVPIADIAEQLGVEPAEIESDLELLACCGLDRYNPQAAIPLLIEDGVVTVYGDLPALDRPLRLSAREAQALATALSSAGMGGNDPLAAKLLAAAADGSQTADIELTLRAAAAPGSGFTLKPLVLAAQEHRVVRIEYRSYGRDGETERTIEPLSVVQDLGAWYVRAFCRETGFVQTFRVDRIKDARLTTELFTPRESELTASALDTSGLPTARVHFSADTSFDTRDWPGSVVAESDESGTTVEIPYAGPGWVARQVVARLGGAEVLGPAEVREAVLGIAREELARLGDS